MVIELVLATSNSHKVREIREMLKGFSGIEVLSLSAFPDYTPPEETGATFEENAELKAKSAAKALGKWVLADDSGLVVPSLNGDPGIRSARYAGEESTDADNRKKLLEQMKGMNEEERAAMMVCCAVLASPDGEVHSGKGVAEGTILDTPRGGSGFGYDCLFLKNDYGKTFAELDEATKNRISHRRKAIDRLHNDLETLNDLP